MRDPAAFFWIVRELLRAFPDVVRTRTPMTWSDLTKWRRLRRQPPAWYPRIRGAVRSAGLVPITVGITTRNRQLSLSKALASLALVRELLVSIIVVDDASEIPVDTAGLPSDLADTLRIIRQPQARGNIAGRNEIMRAATTEYVLLSDDDAYLLDAETIRKGLALMEGDTSVAAVGFAMAAPDGACGPNTCKPRPLRIHASSRRTSALPT